MQRALFIAATGMRAQQLNIDVIANNLANVNTTGFKRSRADFQDLLYQTLRQPGAASSTQTEIPTGIQLGLGTRTAAVQRLFLQGDMQETKNQLDLAIDGAGFFQILLPNGEVAYTRAGAFKLDSQGRIVNSDGYPLEPEIVIPTDATSITIGADGVVSVLRPGDRNPQQIGQIQLVNFANPAGLLGLGRGLFQATTASGEPLVGIPGQDGLGSLSQGFLEVSNVSVVEELVNLIAGQRAYEINSRAIQAADEMLQTAVNLRR
ncbi:MAG: flagellar basal-body rod protein FlgG [Candidatus Tectimicrobiota bacterium]|nr:MAG: flagellar basal-body rod protein FlgG [Candidatus Tectomicrobia bacterium]